MGAYSSDDPWEPLGAMVHLKGLVVLVGFHLFLYDFCCCFYIRIYIIFERHSNSLPRYQDLNVYRLRPVTLDGGVGLKKLRAV